MFAKPYFQIMQEEAWGYSAVRFIAHTQFEKDSFIRVAQEKYVKSFVQRLSHLARLSLPHLPNEILMFRLNFAAVSLIQHLASSRLERTGWFHDDNENSDKILDIYLDYSAAGMSAPFANSNLTEQAVSKPTEKLRLLV